MSNSVSPQAKLVQDLGQGFHNKDLDAIAKTLHKDFRYVTYPRSLNLQDKTKEEFLEYLKGIVPLWTEVKASYFSHRTSFVAANSIPQETNHSITEAPGKVIVHVRISNVEITTAATQRGIRFTVY